ncbi:MAG: hypothetical protein H6642_07145 [Caldilineaceae bacterium]|nr:hypothetical protein [Caldilineaceae bacterium]
MSFSYINILIGVLVGIIFTYDYIKFDRSENPGRFDKLVAARFMVAGVALVGPLFASAVSEAQTISIWAFNFLPALMITTIALVSIGYFIEFKKITNQLDDIDSSDIPHFSFLEYIRMGGSKFQATVSEAKNSSDATRAQKSKRLIKKLDADIRKIVNLAVLSLIDSSLSEEYDLSEEYEDVAVVDHELQTIIFIMTLLVAKVFGEPTARFTLRKYCPDSNSMKAIYCTNVEETPRPIPLTKKGKNMIQRSYQTGLPAEFSLNRKHHYSTGKKGEKRYFDDYVTYCINAKDGKPYLSVNLDVKGQDAIDKMRALVDGGTFTVLLTIAKTNYELLVEEEDYDSDQ